ncbi:toll-like receptor 4 [Haliotis cracherodii]|uniref:toll-like receptor 4 n=1 Tax=Haliotis cracherodii TaxID=6455 RepID=UPI0039E886D6
MAIASPVVLVAVFSLTWSAGTNVSTGHCRCNETRLQLVVDCSSCDLNSVPNNLRVDVEVLLLSHNNIRHLNKSLNRYQNLQRLDISYNNLIGLNETDFINMLNLEYLDVSSNRDLGLANVGIGLSGLINSSLKILKANRLHRYQGPGIVVRRQDLEFVQHTKIEEIHLDGNRIELMDCTVPLLMPRSLRRISLKNNMFLFGLYLLTSSELTLEWADFSQQHSSYIRPFSVDEMLTVNSAKNERIGSLSQPWPNCESKLSINKAPVGLSDGPWPGNWTIFIPPNMTFLNVSSSKLSFNILRMGLGPNNLKQLDLSYNFFTRWEGPVFGTGTIETIDLSHNYCGYIHDNFIPKPNSVKTLKANSNYLGLSLGNNSFSSLVNLVNLVLSVNKISSLPPNILKDLWSLQYLDISSNSLNSWDTDIESMSNLTKLDLSSNLFTEIPQRLRFHIDNIFHHSFKLVVHNNPLNCDCLTLSSLKWMERKGEGVVDIEMLTCKFVDGRELNMTKLHGIVMDLEKICASYVGIMIGALSIVLLILGVGISGVAYRYRWRLRYLYYLVLNRYRGYIPARDEEQEFEFDAFVSYADEDRTFVVRDMRQILEEQERPEDKFSLCIHHRDFLPGEAIAANILKAISSSRKTVVILTRNFLKSYWCRYEMEMAKMESIYTGRNTLLVVVMEDIPVKDLPMDIVEVMRRDSYVEFTDDMEGNAVFWHSLKRGLRA